MPCGSMLRPVTRRLVVFATAEQFEPFTDWLPAVGMDKVRLTIKRKNVQTAGGGSPTPVALNLKPAMQVALARPDNAGNYSLISGLGPYVGAGESNTAEQDISAATAGQMFVRFGVAAYLSGSNPVSGQADVEVQVAPVSCGRAIASVTGEYLVYNTTSDSIVSLTEWIPAVDVEKVAAVFIVSDIANAFECTLVYRTAETNIHNPGSWQAFAGLNPVSSVGETGTGELALSAGSKMFVQVGLAYRQSSAGSAPGRATLTTIIAVRRS